jgi:hypothetical protein
MHITAFCFASESVSCYLTFGPQCRTSFFYYFWTLAKVTLAVICFNNRGFVLKFLQSPILYLIEMVKFTVISIRKLASPF